MAPKGIIVGTLLVFVLAIVSKGALAQSGCTSVLIGMASCLSYVSGSASTPSTSCCSALANVVQTQPWCLCVIASGDGGGSLGVSINQTLALGLPSVCNVETPPVSRCNAANGPAMSPVGSPESSPPESADGSPASPTSPSVTGSKTTPSSGTTSNGSTTKNNLIQLIFVFITASYASAAFNNIF
ncbi:non-specific lipid-transfer protein-like protein at2g13820 [Phtheirospermum japonicum]|uniref:Non-specific lipid-transfer protein-like protein at2g13820 n=1 Tax=Phtheirospermum japonicum TaxID=374723 RepID=A0A830BAM7_9LAMI|nr:non-specific lipid-transfer protein-like protein at2g13820 [Phtheirospermum japonicum]